MAFAGWLWAWPRVRRRWRVVVVLGLVAALAAGLATAAATGARRSEDVIDEVLWERLQPDVMSLPSRPGFDWSEIVALPYVEAYGLFAVSGMCLTESGGLNAEGAVCGQPPVDGGLQESIDRHDVVAGRMPVAPDEIAVNWIARERFGWDVGQTLHLETVGAGNLDLFWSGASPGPAGWGPTFEVTVTGVTVGTDAWRLISGGIPGAGMVMSREFIAAHGHLLDYRVDAFLRLDGGATDVGRFRADIAAVTGDPTVPVRDVHEAERRVERGTSLEAAALWLFAGAAFLVAAVLVGQAVARLVRAGAGEAPVLRSLGMTARELGVTLALPGLAAAALGAVATPVFGLALSPLFPIGMARSFDRHPGVKADLPVLVAGVAGVAAVLALSALVAGALAARLARRGTAPSGAPRATSGLVTVLRRLRMPLSAELGARLVVDRRFGQDLALVRPGFVGVVVAVTAVVAAFTFRAGLDDTSARPERAGQVWDIALLPGTPDETIQADPAIVAAAEVIRSRVNLDGVPVPVYVRRPIGADLDIAVLDGRLPSADDEIALAPSTAEILGAAPGHTVPGGPDGTVDMRVVGIALTVEVGGHSAYDEGGWLSVPGLERLQPGEADWSSTMVDVSDHVDVSTVRDRMVAAGAVLNVGQLVTPAGLENLERTRDLPTVLGGFLVVLGLGALGHALSGTIRRRRRDLAVLRALGCTPGQVRVVVAWAAMTSAAVGAVVGVPLGVAAGRLAWQWIATSMPLVHVPPTAWPAVVLTMPAVFAVTLAVAYAPARSASTGRPARVLRAE